jgi:glycine/D-amino acid oxidase-like deaminating enzyme
LNEVLIVGAGIGGLALALELARRDISCRVFESAPEIKPLGVGINLLPHATQVLGELGLEPALAKVAVQTQEAAFYNRSSTGSGSAAAPATPGRSSRSTAATCRRCCSTRCGKGWAPLACTWAGIASGSSRRNRKSGCDSAIAVPWKEESPWAATASTR